MAGQDRVHLRRQRRREPRHHGQCVVLHHLDGGQQRVALRPLRHPGRRPGVQLDALLQHQTGVDPGRDLDVGGVPPGGDRVAPRLDVVRPPAGRAGGHGGAPAVGAGRQLAHRRPRAGPALRVGEHDVRGDRVVALPEHGGGDLERLAGHRLGRMPAALHGRAHVPHRDAADDRGRTRGRTHGCHLHCVRGRARPAGIRGPAGTPGLRGPCGLVGIGPVLFVLPLVLPCRGLDCRGPSCSVPRARAPPCPGRGGYYVPARERRSSALRRPRRPTTPPTCGRSLCSRR